MSSSYKMDNMPLNDTNVSSTSSSPNNPILLLGDYCFRNRMKTAPVYDFQQLAETSNGNAWECCVTVGQHVIKRCGQNKRMARHNAAKAMLDELNEHQGSRVQSPSHQSSSVQQLGGQQTIPVNNQQLTAAPSDAALCVETLSSRPILTNNPPPKTPIMILKERCRDQKGIEPKYDDLQNQIGIASFECCVTVGEQFAKGWGRNKQEARQMAAKAFLEKLNNQESSVQESNDQGSSDPRSNVQESSEVASSEVESSVQESRAVNNQQLTTAPTDIAACAESLSSRPILMNSPPPKTPLMLLNERCTQKGIQPKFDLREIGIASFECCVTVGEQVANGCGRNKQEARQMAAKAILEKLNNHESSVQESSDQRSSDLRSNVQGSSDVESSVQESRAVNNQLSIVASTKATPSVGILSSTASNVSKTPVSLLEELRVKERTALKYNLEQSNRRNNRGIFSSIFRYSVTFGKLTVTGSEQRNMKAAKHMAAQAMLDLLNDQRSSVQQSSDEGTDVERSMAVKNEQMAAPPKAVNVVQSPFTIDAHGDGLDGMCLVFLILF